MRPTGSHFAQIQFQRLQALLHLLFSRFLNIGDHNVSIIKFINYREGEVQTLPQRCVSLVTFGTRMNSHLNQRSLVFAHHYSFQCSGLKDAEHFERQFLVAAKSQCRSVHHLKILGNGYIK